MDQYLPIDQFESVSSRGKYYTVCLRTTPGKPVILTCNCPGWTRRCPDGTDASRTCKHVENPRSRRALEQYQLKGKVSTLSAKPVIKTKSPEIVEKIKAAAEQAGADIMAGVVAEIVMPDNISRLVRAEMPSNKEVLEQELRTAREWLGLDEIQGQVDRRSRSL